MTIGTSARVSVNCDGITKIFPIAIQAYQATDITVIHTTAAGSEVTLILNSDYSLSASGTLAPPAQTLTTLSATAFPAGDTLQAFINPVQSQQTQYVQGQQFPSLAVQTNVDRLTQMVQRLQDQLNRAIIAPDGDVSPVMALVPASQRANLAQLYDSFGNATVGLPVTGTMTGQIIANLLNAITTTAPTADRVRTAAEIAAGVTPINFAYASGDSRRMAPDTTGATDVTTKLQNLLDIAGLAASNGDIKIVTLYPGTYKVTRLYMHYSNVWLLLMPGATILQTQTGITNNNTTGQSPAYAIIHVNPLAYLNNPSSAVTAISNVRIYGGGTVQGPYLTTHAYDGFAMGIVSNDCHKFWVTEISVLGCGGENVLLNPSAWNTCTDLRTIGNEIQQGGGVGINNARAFLILHNYVHDSWSQNGIGGDGDNGIVGFNRARNMAGGALTPGGSGAKDIGVSREILYIGNTSTATGLTIAGTYAFFCSDDGATTVPKYNHRYIGNTFDAHNGPIGIGCDYATALNCCIENNTVTSLVFAGGTGADFQVVAGSGQYYLRGNNFNPGLTGNAGYGVTNSSAGTPAINIEEGNDISGHGTADINWSAGINLKGEFFINSLILVLTGFAAGLNVPIFVVKKGNNVTINFTSTNGTSNATTMTLGTLPVYLRPTRAQNFLIVVADNGVNSIGILQIAATGVMTFFKDINGAAFTNSGTKGITGPYNITYLLS